MVSGISPVLHRVNYFTITLACRVMRNGWHTQGCMGPFSSFSVNKQGSCWDPDQKSLHPCLRLRASVKGCLEEGIYSVLNN